MWRSEAMSFLRLFVPIEAAHAFVDEMARRGVMQFVDLNVDIQAFQRRHIRSIVAINDVMRSLDAIEQYLTTYDVPHDVSEIEYLTCSPITTSSIDEVIVAVKTYHTRLMNDFNVAAEFKAQLLREQELEDVLEQSSILLDSKVVDMEVNLRNNGINGDNQPLLQSDLESGPRLDSEGLRFVGGITDKKQKLGLERQIFLASRGNAYAVFVDLPDDDAKIPFVIFFLGEYLERKITKLCNVMSINIYLNSNDQIEISNRLSDSRTRQSELRETLYRTETQLKHDLFGVASRFSDWKRILTQGKAIYSTLNLFRVNETAQMVQVDGWVPTADQIIVREALRSALDSKGFAPRTNPSVVQDLQLSSVAATPPTFFRTNKFTSAYQQIVDTYGVPRYGEINPGFLTVVTFPFLFGVMYGDVFHGTALFLFAFWVIWNEKKIGSSGKLNDAMSAAYHGRYMLILMGFFATYCGLIYNDFTSLPLHLFPSSYNEDTKSFTGVYPFGVDHVWYGTNVELALLNSLKMKLAIVIGVTQMTVGIFISLFNHIHFRDWPSIIFDFVPQIIFMMSFFGYMCFVIILKWIRPWSSIAGAEYNLHDAPNLIAALIDMVLHFGTVQTTLLFQSQEWVQRLLMILLGVSVPWMLIPKPIVLYMMDKGRRRQALSAVAAAHYQAIPLESISSPSEQGESHHSEEPFDVGEHVVHQLIHTIEFVLGCVSNTASYLRLWALSLAHAQLASVFYTKLVSGNYASPIGLFMGFIFFTSATFGVLLCMDVLECFLHALRLHWVEFQNKFYHADGIAFEPFYYLTFNKQV